MGEASTSLDYDMDGRVDVFVVNGPFSDFDRNGIPRAFGDDGPSELFRNTTVNDNHWLAIDLDGTVSNRDAIGASIEVTAGGITQLREQNGGIHRWSQNHGIHFGLGPHAIADQVVVRWPTGTTTTLTNVAADTLITIQEPGSAPLTVQTRPQQQLQTAPGRALAVPSGALPSESCSCDGCRGR